MLLNIDQDSEGKRVAAEYESSNLRRSIFFPETKQLMIEFVKGGKYVYSPVTEDQHRSLLLAPSPGSYFIKNIKNDSKITFRKVTDESEIVSAAPVAENTEDVQEKVAEAESGKE